MTRPGREASAGRSAFVRRPPVSHFHSKVTREKSFRLASAAEPSLSFGKGTLGGGRAKVRLETEPARGGKSKRGQSQRAGTLLLRENFVFRSECLSLARSLARLDKQLGSGQRGNNLFFPLFVASSAPRGRDEREARQTGGRPAGKELSGQPTSLAAF